MIVTIILAKADSFDFLLPPAKAGGILNEGSIPNRHVFAKH